jgi:hypothetical protein
MQAVPAKDTKGGAQPAAPSAKAIQVVQLKRNDLTLAELSNNDWRSIAPEGATAEALDLHPEFWNLVADNLHGADTVKVLAHDRTWLGFYLVLDAGPGYAAVKLMYAAKIPLRGASAARQLPPNWRIVRSGPREPEGFYAIEIDPATGEPTGRKILNSSLPFATHEEARRGLLDHAIFSEPQGARYTP